MASRKQAGPSTSAEALGLKLLQSAREMKARNSARNTQLPVNGVIEAATAMIHRKPNLPPR